jgi:hypothetical protein
MPVRIRTPTRSARPECGTLCCRQRRMAALLHAARSSFSSHAPQKLRPASGRAGATLGASRASRSPEFGTLCCRQWRMAALLHAARSSSSSSLARKSFAPHPTGCQPPTSTQSDSNGTQTPSEIASRSPIIARPKSNHPLGGVVKPITCTKVS